MRPVSRCYTDGPKGSLGINLARLVQSSEIEPIYNAQSYLRLNPNLDKPEILSAD